MKRLLDFKTTLDRQTIIATLRDNTFPTDYDFQTLLFGKYYFSGQVGGKTIRLRNAIRSPKSPSPILDITLLAKDDLMKVMIYDDTDDDIRVNTMMTMTITGSISIVVLLVGSILSFVQPGNYSIFWTIAVSVMIAGFGLVNSYYYKEGLSVNTRADLEFLVKLLQR